MLYLDHAATTPLRTEAAAAMAPYLGEIFGNPSGTHGVARRVRDAVEEARERAAALLGAGRPLDVVFTGSGTEADNLAVTGAAFADPMRVGVVVTAVEHAAVLEAAHFIERRGGRSTVVAVDPAGTVTPGDVARAVGPDTAVVSVMLANNETGAIQPVRAVAETVHGVDGEVPVHTDAVQAFASLPVTFPDTGADLISLSAHKFGGPQGVGLLATREGVRLEPVVHGGGQEIGRRSGTHNVAGIVGMVAAMEAAVAERASYRRTVGAARNRFESALREDPGDVVITGEGRERLPSHSHLRFPGCETETLLIRLDQEGIAAAAGSACHSGAITPSHVLAAMGWDTRAAGEAVRFTFGRTASTADAEEAAARVARVVRSLR